MRFTLALFVAAAQSSSEQVLVFVFLTHIQFQFSKDLANRYGRDIIPYCISKKY